MSKPLIKSLILPPNTYFFSIPFENSDMRLTNTLLEKYYENVPKGHRAYMGVKREFISYEIDMITMSVLLPGDTLHYVYLHVEPMELFIGCTCGMPSEKLCKHGYFALHWMSDTSDGFDFMHLYCMFFC